MRLHPPWPPACLPSVVEHGARRKQRARRVGQSGDLSRVTAPFAQDCCWAGCAPGDFAPCVCPGVRARQLVGHDFDFPFQPLKILTQHGLTTSGREYAHHSRHVHCTYGDEPVGSRRGTPPALFCGPERITKRLESGEHPSERSGTIMTLF